MGASTQLSFVPKISGEFLSIWAKFLQISKFFGWPMDEIRPNWEKLARNFWGRTSTARIRPKKYLRCRYFSGRTRRIHAFEIRPRKFQANFFRFERILSIVKPKTLLIWGSFNQIGINLPEILEAKFIRADSLISGEKNNYCVQFFIESFVLLNWFHLQKKLFFLLQILTL
jgi:hypothetical protein